MSCGAFSLIGISGSEATVIPVRCKRWTCPSCGRRKARRVMAQVRAGMDLGPTRFFTITSPGDEDGGTSYACFPERWKRLHERIRRRFGPIEYLGVVEAQKRGAAHFHAVYRGPFIPQRWLSRAAAECGFGPIADIRKTHARLMSYLAKYLTKDLNADGATGRTPVKLPKYFRRVRISAHWCDRRRLARSPQMQWWIADVGQLQAAADAKARGFTIVGLFFADAGGLPCSERVVRWLKSLREYRPWALEPLGRAA